MLGHVEVRAHQNEHPIRVVRTRSPDLLAVNHKVVAIVIGPGPQAGKVATGAGLAVALTPLHLGLRDSRQVAQLLFFGSKLQQRGADHARAETREWRTRAEPRHLFEQANVFIFAESAAAILRRPVWHRPTLLDHAFEPQQRV